MKYLNKKFIVGYSRYSGKKYEENYDRIFRRSKCCNASVRIEGKTTKYYICNKCNKPCEVLG